MRSMKDWYKVPQAITAPRKDSYGYQEYPGVELDNYDFSAERHSVYSTNLIESTAHLIKGCLGVGVLSIHVGYMYAGIWTALAATIFIGIAMCCCMMMLVRSAHKLYVTLRIPKLSYPDLAEVALATAPWKVMRKFSKPFRYCVDICLFAEMCGSCCIYEIMIAKTMKKFLESISSSVQSWDMSERAYIIMVAAPLLLLCIIRKLKYLAPFSVVANIVIGISVLATMYYSIKSVGKISERPIWKSVHGLIRFCGVCLYSLDGIAIVMPIENSMQKPMYFRIVVQYGMTISVVLIACTGFFGYWGWGDECESPVTTHMPPEIVPTMLQFLLAVMLSVTFAVQFWVPFRVVWYYIGKKYHISSRSGWERFYRVVLVLMITAIAIAFPNLVRLMIFIGNFFLGLISFLFPAIIDASVTWREHRGGGIRWGLSKNIVLILIGAFICGGAFYSAIDM